MATKTFEELKQLAIQIRDEKTNKQNTATRVGTAMLEHINKLEQDYYDKTTINNRTSEYNVSINHPTSGISSSNKYDLSSAIAQVPAELRTAGLKVSFLNSAGKPESWKYQGGSWAVANFIKEADGGNKILTWVTDAATTRKQVSANERKAGMQISYTPDGENWVNEQYIGSVYSDYEWGRDINWIKIPDKKQIDEVKNNNISTRWHKTNMLDPEKIYFASSNAGYVRPEESELGNAVDIEIPNTTKVLTVVAITGYLNSLPQVDCFQGSKHLGFATKSNVSTQNDLVTEKVATYTLQEGTDNVKVFTSLKGVECNLGSISVYLSDIREYNYYDTFNKEMSQMREFILKDKSLKIKLPQINSYRIKINIPLPKNYIYKISVLDDEDNNDSSAKVYVRNKLQYSSVIGDLKPIDFDAEDVLIVLQNKSNEKQYYIEIECDNTAISKGMPEDTNKLSAIPLIQTSKIIGRGIIGDGINAKPENYPVYGKGGATNYLSDFINVKGNTDYFLLRHYPKIAEYDVNKQFIRNVDTQEYVQGFYLYKSEQDANFIIIQEYSSSDATNTVIPIIHFDLPSADKNTNRRFLEIVKNKALTLSYGDTIYSLPDTFKVDGTFCIGDSIAARITSLVKGLKWLSTATYGGCTVDVYVADKFTRCSDLLTYENIKGADVVISTGTNDQDYFKSYNDFAGRNLLALYSQLVTELRALGAKNIFCVGPFVGTSSTTYEEYEKLPVRTALKAFFGGNFIDICEYMFELGLCFNPYHILPFTQPEVGGNVTITVDNADAFFGNNPIMKEGADFYVQYCKLTPEGNAYDKYTVVSIDKEQSQAVVTLKENHSDVTPGETGGYYTTSYNSPAITNVNRARYGWVYTEQDLTDVTQNKLPRSIGESTNSGDPHWNMLVAKHVENMLFVRGAIRE